MTNSAAIRDDERIALALMQAIRADAEQACAPATVDLVSVALDVTQSAARFAGVSFTPRIDRKTRTILFTGGAAQVEGRAVMTATAIYRISPPA